MPQLTFEDTTPEALTKNLAEGWPSSALWSDEAAIVLSSPGMKNDSAKFVALLNRLWEGKSIGIHRKSTKDVRVTHRRFTLSLMMQPLVLEQMLKKGSGIIRHSGFLARVLMTYPNSTMGQRFYKEPEDISSLLGDYNQRIQDCLTQTLINGKEGFKNIEVLSFSSEAKKEWVAVFNDIEHGLNDKKIWQPINDLASKAAENIARLSALFHLYEGASGSISKDNVARAYEIITWHLNEAKRILHADLTQSKAENDAQRIIKWIQEKSLKQTTPREVLQSSPVRDKKSRDDAIALLEKTNYLKITQQGTASIILLNPELV